MNRIGDHQFVTIGGSLCFCANCLPKDVELGAPTVKIWDDFTTGWRKAPVCALCKLSMPVFLGVDMEDVIDEKALRGARVESRSEKAIT